MESILSQITDFILPIDSKCADSSGKFIAMPLKITFHCLSRVTKISDSFQKGLHEKLSNHCHKPKDESASEEDVRWRYVQQGLTYLSELGLQIANQTTYQV